MQDFYTNVNCYGDNIYYCGYRNNKKINVKIPYSPSLFIPHNNESSYKTIYGDNLKKIKFDSIKKSREFVKQYSTVDNFNLYGNTKFEYCFISDIFKNDIEWDISNLKIAIVDIEVNSDPKTGGFSKPEDPFQPITSIALKFLNQNKIYLFGYFDFDVPEHVEYYKCKDEYSLYKKFLEIWSNDYPDIVSGWNSTLFDINYIINRFNKILGEKETKKLSPFNIIKDKSKKIFNDKLKRYEEETRYNIFGISLLDYLELYKKHYPNGNSKESHTLDFIAETEINERKLPYEGTLHKLYTENKQLFYEYNIQDVLLIEKLNKKCRLFELSCALTYEFKCNFEDVFHQTRMWDSKIYNFLKLENIQIPIVDIKHDSNYEGGYVKDPIVGMHKWIATIDATSLYPSIIMGKNISPEMIIDQKDYNNDLKSIISQNINVNSLLNKTIDLSLLKKNNVTLTPNGNFFKKNKKGFLPRIIEKMFQSRKEYKKKKIQFEKDYEKLKSKHKNNLESIKKECEEFEFNIAKFDTFQNAMKISMNSCYGVLASIFFRFFDIRLAEGITLEGQLANKWVAQNVNDYLNKQLNTDEDYILFMDTDSCGLSLEKYVNKFCLYKNEPKDIVQFLIDSINDDIQPQVNDYCTQLNNYVNSFDNAISYKLEKICSSGIFTAKKRYALNVYSNEGVIYSKPEIKVTGLEVVKSSTPKFVREKLKRCISIILNDNNKILCDYINNIEKEFKEKYIEEISFPRGVHGLTKYSDNTLVYKKSTPIHVRGSLLFNKLLKDKNLDKEYEYIKEGDKIKFCYLKMPNIIFEDVISFIDKLPNEFELQSYIDYDKMYNKTFIEPLKVLTDLVGWRIEDSNSLLDFFG